MSNELEAQARLYEEKRSQSRTIGCFSGCMTFLVPFIFSFQAATPVVMVLTFGLGIFFMIRGLNARAKRDELYGKMGAEKTKNGWRTAPTPQAYVPPQTGWQEAQTPQVYSAPGEIKNLPQVSGIPQENLVDPWTLGTSSATGTTPPQPQATPAAEPSAATPPAGGTAAQDGQYADDDKLGDRLKKAKKSGF